MLRQSSQIATETTLQDAIAFAEKIRTIIETTTALGGRPDASRM